jgi:hypothetical protein
VSSSSYHLHYLTSNLLLSLFFFPFSFLTRAQEEQQTASTPATSQEPSPSAFGDEDKGEFVSLQDQPQQHGYNINLRQSGGPL